MANDLELLERWRQGDENAAGDLFRRYAGRLIGLVQQHLSEQLGRRVDAEDVLQSAFRSFFSGARDGRFLLESSDDLWHLLVAISLHKVRRQSRRHKASKRSLERETPASTDSLHGLDAELLAREPSPDEAASLAELLEQLMGSFPAEQRRMLEMRLQGYQHEEIAAELGCCRQTVMRVLRRARTQLEEWADAVSE
ncbi:MAG: RNA polymerase sigma factor [Gemmataceae bacterium]